MAKRSIEVNTENLDKLFKALSYAERVKAARQGFAAIAREARKMAVEAATSQITFRNSRTIAETIWASPFKSTAGFRLAVTPKKGAKNRPGKGSGYYRNQRGKSITLAMWANVGAYNRKTRKTKKNRGSIEAFHYLESVEPRILEMANRDFEQVIFKYMAKAAKKNGAQFN